MKRNDFIHHMILTITDGNGAALRPILFDKRALQNHIDNVTVKAAHIADMVDSRVPFDREEP